MDVLLGFLFLGLLIASYRDMQTREVPDTVSMGLMALGLLGGLVTGMIGKNVYIFYEHLAGLVAGAILGFGMYFTKQWGGGDAKLLMGVGAILGLSFTNLSLLEFLVLLAVSGAVYGVAYTAFLAFRSRKTFIKGFKKEIRTPRVHRTRIALVVGGFILLIGIIMSEWRMRFVLLFALVAIYILTYTWVASRVIEKTIMTKTYPVGKLTEGDWLVEPVKVKGKEIVPARNTGLTKDDIKVLKKRKVKTVTVREGIPFVPSFLIALILLVIAQEFPGGLLWLLL